MRIHLLRILVGSLISVLLQIQAYAISEGKPAPELSAKLLDGQKVTLRDNVGKVVLINFWATWCAPCREEMPALEMYYQKHKGEGFEILAISVDEPANEARVKDIMRSFTFSAAMGRDADAKAYGRIWRVPLTFVIDRHGVLRKDGWHGDPKIDLPLLEKTVTPLLNEK